MAWICCRTTRNTQMVILNSRLSKYFQICEEIHRSCPYRNKCIWNSYSQPVFFCKFQYSLLALPDDCNFSYSFAVSEAVTWRCSVKKVFLNILIVIKKKMTMIFDQIHRKTPLLRLFFDKNRFRPATLLKKLQHRCFSVNFAKL